MKLVGSQVKKYGARQSFVSRWHIKYQTKNWGHRQLIITVVLSEVHNCELAHHSPVGKGIVASLFLQTRKIEGSCVPPWSTPFSIVNEVLLDLHCDNMSIALTRENYWVWKWNGRITYLAMERMGPQHSMRTAAGCHHPRGLHPERWEHGVGALSGHWVGSCPYSTEGRSMSSCEYELDS